MTTDCCNPDARPKPAVFAYNPYEVALCGPRGDARDALAGGLARALAKELRLALVNRDAGLEGGLDDGVLATGALCIDGAPHRTIMYRPEQEGPLAPQPLIDADLAVVLDGQGDGLWKVALVGDGEPATRDKVIAYVGAKRACPVLPAHARYFFDDEIEALAACVLEHLRAQAAAIPLYGLVLAGGQSTRMKKDKAALVYAGKPQAVRCHELLGRHCARVYVSSRAEQTGEGALAGLPQIHDAFLGLGPLGGILSAQKTHPEAAWLVLACDLPYLDEETLANLAARRNPFKLATAYKAAEGGLPEPLCAIYEPKSIHRLLAFVAQGCHCPRKILRRSDACLLDLENPGALANANTPDEYAEAQRALAAREKVMG